ncbi:MAG: GldG family protein [Polyangiales bacterium]
MALPVRMRAARESLSFLALIGGVLILLNILGVSFFLRADVTENDAFSLSDGSRRVAASFTDEVIVNAYFTENLPPPFNATARYVRDILAEYEHASQGKIKVRFINPDDEEKQEAAERDGVQRVAHQKLENDSVNVQEGYRGLVIKYLGEKELLPVIEDTEGLEYEITQKLKKLSGDKKTVGLISGHEGPTLQKGLSGLQRALPTYTLKEVSAASPIDTSLDAVLIIAPEKPFTDEELRNLDAFVMQGKSLGVFGGSLKVDLQGGAGPSVSKVDTQINKLIGPWGIEMKSKLVADWVAVLTRMPSALGIPVPVRYPPVPVLSFGEQSRAHPVLFRLNNAAFHFTAPLKVTRKAMKAKQKAGSTDPRKLAFSSEYSWLLPEGEFSNLQPKPPQQWNRRGRSGPFTLMAAVEGKLASAFAKPAMSGAEAGLSPKGPEKAKQPVRVLVAGSGAMFRDEFLPPPGQGDPRQAAAMLALPLNAIDWLAQDADLIAVRAKNVEEPALQIPEAVRQAEEEAKSAAEKQDAGKVEKALAERQAAIDAWDSKKATFRWLNTLGIPLLFIIYGLLRWRWRLARPMPA